MSRPRLGLRALLQATCEAWDQVEGPSLDAAVLAIVRERPRLRAIISDMREGVERLKIECSQAIAQSVTERLNALIERDNLKAAHTLTCDALAASKKQEQILKDCLADVRLQRDRAEQAVDALTVDLAQASSAADTLLTGLEDCRHALADMTSERDEAVATSNALHTALDEARRIAHEDRLVSIEAIDRLAAMEAQHDQAKPASKARPQPGDAVPWAEVEDGALYFRPGYALPFRVVADGKCMQMTGPHDGDITNREYWYDPKEINDDGPAVLIARNLGSDPEAWRAAMREWTANGNRPPPADPRSLTLAEVNAAERVAAWPQWKRDLSPDVDPTTAPPAPTANEDAG